MAECILKHTLRIDVVVDVHDPGFLVDGAVVDAHFLGNSTSTAVANCLDGVVNLISAPYSSRMLRVIVRPRPMPWPRVASTLAVVVRNGSNQRSDVSSLTAFPVFSI